MLINPQDLKRSHSYALTIASIIPRPIAWVSTLNKDSQPNLSPFSFFNAITNDPLTLMVSIGRRKGERKDTANNLLEVPQAVIHIPTEDFLHHVVLSSADFDKSINEFNEVGLTPIASEIVKPYRIKELPLAMECEVVKHELIGNEPNDVFFFEVRCMHIDDALVDANMIPKTSLFNALGRLGHGDYVKVNKNTATLPRPTSPEEVKNKTWPPQIRKT
ncbi:MAG: flavin reductase family protein [Methylacidiphilales bacterium]|nr:flavin reductase family protein [Candidatus Methylacidiphilales bacterium]